MLAATNNVDEAIVTAAGSLFTKALIEELKVSAASGSSMCVTELFSCLRHNRLLLQQSPHHDQLRDQQFPIPIQPLVPQEWNENPGGSKITKPKDEPQHLAKTALSPPESGDGTCLYPARLKGSGNVEDIFEAMCKLNTLCSFNIITAEFASKHDLDIPCRSPNDRVARGFILQGWRELAGFLRDTHAHGR